MWLTLARPTLQSWLRHWCSFQTPTLSTRVGQSLPIVNPHGLSEFLFNNKLRLQQSTLSSPIFSNLLMNLLCDQKTLLSASDSPPLPPPLRVSPPLLTCYCTTTNNCNYLELDETNSSTTKRALLPPTTPISEGWIPEFKVYTVTMLKAPDHQVAGHQARDGKLGPLIDDLGRFCKPLQNGDRGSREMTFYTALSSNPNIPDHIRRYFPVFFATQLLEASDGSGLHPHLILQDLLATRRHPSVMDIKIGSRTWYPQSSEEYIQKCLRKDREGTSLSLGFRISGLKTYVNEESGFWKPEKKYVQSFTKEDVWLSLKKFVSSNPLSNAEPDCSLASVVYGGSDGILAQLLELKAWFEVQTIFHFYSCSVLVMYEKDADIPRPEVKLIDFAHVVDGQGIIDHNFLGGLCSLIKFISDILTNPAGKGGSSDCKNNKICFQNGYRE